MSLRRMHSSTLGALALVTAPLAAQQPGEAPERPSRLGLAAIGLYGIDGGAATVAHAGTGFEGGAVLDLGWVGTRRLRLVGDVGLLSALSAPHPTPGTAILRARFFDFSVNAGLTYAFPRWWRIEPYVGGAVGVHAVNSASGNLDIDIKYNSNRIGALGTAGAIALLTRDGRTGARVELRGVGAHGISRAGVRLGIVRYVGERIRALGGASAIDEGR